MVSVAQEGEWVVFFQSAVKIWATFLPESDNFSERSRSQACSAQKLTWSLCYCMCCLLLLCLQALFVMAVMTATTKQPGGGY